MQKILFLAPVFQERIWGGTNLNKSFGYTLPNDLIGECWAISAHKNGNCKVTNGPLKGFTLSEVYNNHPELFNNSLCDTFPLLTKILDANDDLSVQVHPNDHYALKHEQESGKTECWYILDCKPNSEIIIGHYAKTKDEFINAIQNKNWDQLLKRVSVKPGDFFYVPTGTIHALGKGILVLETQQSSNTTYRVYDYNRQDASGNLRELHVKQAIEVTTIPHIDDVYQKEIRKLDGANITTFVKSEYFTVEKWDVFSELNLTYHQKFLLVSVLNGSGTILGEVITKGDHFIITSLNDEINCHGTLELMVSYL